jgi:hypothetical protein
MEPKVNVLRHNSSVNATSKSITATKINYDPPALSITSLPDSIFVKIKEMMGSSPTRPLSTSPATPLEDAIYNINQSRTEVTPALRSAAWQQPILQSDGKPFPVPITTELNSAMVQFCIESVIDLLLDTNSFAIISKFDFSIPKPLPDLIPTHSPAFSPYTNPNIFTPSLGHLLDDGAMSQDGLGIFVDDLTRAGGSCGSQTTKHRQFEKKMLNNNSGASQLRLKKKRDLLDAPVFATSVPLHNGFFLGLAGVTSASRFPNCVNGNELDQGHDGSSPKKNDLELFYEMFCLDRIVNIPFKTDYPQPQSTPKQESNTKSAAVPIYPHIPNKREVNYLLDVGTGAVVLISEPLSSSATSTLLPPLSSPSSLSFKLNRKAFNQNPYDIYKIKPNAIMSMVNDWITSFLKQFSSLTPRSIIWRWDFVAQINPATRTINRRRYWSNMKINYPKANHHNQGMLLDKNQSFLAQSGGEPFISNMTTALSSPMSKIVA